MNDPTLWNSLEIVKLAISISTPLVVILIGFLINNRVRHIEHMQWTRQRIVDKRIELYDHMIPKINDIYCYLIRVGNWKEFSPEDIIELKREIDKIAHVNAPLFSEKFISLYSSMMECYFDMFRGKGTNARILIDPNEYIQFYEGEWIPSWDDFYDRDKMSSRNEIKNMYHNFVHNFSTEIGVVNNQE